MSGKVDAKRRVVALSVALVALSVAFASVFAYYPVTVAISPVSPPVVFQEGSNANKPDLGAGKTIEVFIGSNSASASITIHPTYRVTYYKDVLRIHNGDSKAHNVHVKVSTAASLPQGSVAKLCIYNSGATRILTNYPTPGPSGYINCVDLTTTGTTYIGSLGAGDTWEVDVYVYIPEGIRLPSSEKAGLYLVYSPSSETPP